MYALHTMNSSQGCIQQTIRGGIGLHHLKITYQGALNSMLPLLSDFKRYPLNCYLNNDKEHFLTFLTFSAIVCTICTASICNVLKQQWKIINVQQCKSLNHPCSDKNYKSTVHVLAT